MLVGVHFYRSTVLETGFTLRGELSTPYLFVAMVTEGAISRGGKSITMIQNTPF